MSKKPPQIFAVLTGDIVGSTKYPDIHRKSLLEKMEEGMELVRNQYQGLVGSSIFSGDSWQMLLSDPTSALEIAVKYRCFLRSGPKVSAIDTRISIGVGKIDFAPENISQGDGEAYRISGRGMQSIRGKQLMSIGFPNNWGDLMAKEMGIIFRLFDLIVSDWTSSQSKAVMLALEEKTQTWIAKEWSKKGISQQAVAKHLDSANWETVEKVMEYFEFRLTRALTKFEG